MKSERNLVDRAASASRSRILVYVVNPEQNGQHYLPLISKDFPAAEVRFATNVEIANSEIVEADVLLTYGMLVDDELIGRANRLKWIHSLISGLDWLDNLQTLGTDVIVTSARGMHGPPVAEMALLMMLALSRRLPLFVANQRDSRWQRVVGSLLFRKTAGILGVGKIGQELALRLKAMGMNIIGISSTERAVPGFDRIVLREKLTEIAPELDFLVTLLPLTPQSRGIVNDAVFSALKPEAFLVHLARGPIVSEPALLDALANRRIAGAGLDVFDIEPLPSSHPLWQMDNVIITPHNAGIYDDYARDSYSLFAENLRLLLAGRAAEMKNRVDRLR